MKTLFSVIIPTYNRAEFLSKAIKSLLQQTYMNWELIVVDDGSTDNTRELVNGFEDSRIHYIWQENSERAVARNNGIRLSKGEFICFLDSDDYFLENHLEVFKNIIDQESERETFIVSNFFQEIDGVRKDFQIYNSKLNDPFRFYWENNILTPTAVCIHRAILQKFQFPEKWKKAYWEDSYLWLNIIANYKFLYTYQTTAVQVEHKLRSINDGCSVDMGRVCDHINMMRDFYKKRNEKLDRILTSSMLKDRIDRKYNMFIYQARINKRFVIAYRILWMALKNKSTISNVLLGGKLLFHMLARHSKRFSY